MLGTQLQLAHDGGAMLMPACSSDLRGEQRSVERRGRMQVATEGTIDLFRIPKRITLAETIADAVARAIASGMLEPDERVTEMAIADRVGVSRAPIREALKILHAQGILAADSSRGFRVAAFDDTTIRQVLESRLALETILLRDAVLQWRVRDPEATALKVPIARMHEAAVNKDRAASLEADLSFHKAISYRFSTATR